MTEKQYETILALLADKVEEQKNKIGFLTWENEDLKKKLAEAEHHLNPTDASAKKLEIR
jgi:hypothetical protein